MSNFVNECMAAIMADNDAKTLADIQRSSYKYTSAGIAVHFGLSDGTFLWNGDQGARDESSVKKVVKIGFSSIIEGSDAEVPTQWLDLSQMPTTEKAVEEFNRLESYVNEWACELYDEVHEE